MSEAAVLHGVRSLLAICGADPDDPSVRDTPKRVLKAMREMTAGRHDDPAAILSTTFDRHAYDQMVVLRGVEFVSLCEHHMLPFTGSAVVAYVPGDRVVGLSKLARLVDCYARRLQIQERMTQQIADALTEHLKPRGAGVVLAASHSCMCSRGVRKSGAEMVTSCLTGVLREKPEARAELLSFLGGT